MRRPKRKGLAKLLLSSSIFPWLICDFAISYGLFRVFSGFGRGTSLSIVQLENNIAAITLSCLFCVTGIGMGFFERENRIRLLEIVKLGLTTWFLAMALGIALLHFAFFMKVGRYALIYGSFASIAGIIAFHAVMANILRKYPQQFAFLGPTSPTLKEILKVISNNARSHLEHNALVSDLINHEQGLEVESNQIQATLSQYAPIDIVLTSNSESDKRSAQVATIALQNGLRVIDEGSFYAEIFRRYPIENLSTHWIVRAGFDIQKPITNGIKRLGDFFGAIFLLIILFVPMVIVSALIKVTSAGPVFFVQVRQGRHSKPFRMIKFRSMTNTKGGNFATERNDARVTWVGKFLRPLHLDELPQLVNIIRGEMSFVGPRPESIEIVEKTRKELPIFEIRHMVRPGLTGWAQINQGKTQDGLDEVRTKLSYDLYYAKNYGLIFDLLIALRTVFVLTKKAW